jgi:hypothetical protein
MRALLAIVLLAAAAWSGWWWFNASMRENAIEDWLAERRADGWVAEASDVSVNGFPNRLDLTVTGLALADPQEGWSWEAPFFQVMSLTWKPHHFIAIWPDEQVFASPYERAVIENSRMRGSVVFAPGLDLALDRSTVEIENLTVTGDAGWTASLAEAVLSTRRAEGERARGPHDYDLNLEAAGLALPEDWAAGLDRAGVLPTRMEAAGFDLTLAFDRPWDRHAIEDRNPALEGVVVRDMRLSWGRLDLRGRGELVADARGYAEGRLDLRVRNWQEMLEIAVRADLIGRSTARAVETGLDLMSRFGGSRNAIDVPLVFEGGRMLLAGPIGSISIGDAPRLTSRR